MEKKAHLHCDEWINSKIIEIEHKWSSHKVWDLVTITINGFRNEITFTWKIVWYSEELKHNRIHILDSLWDSYDFIVNEYVEIRKISTDENNSLIERINADFSNIGEIIKSNNIEELQLILKHIKLQLSYFGIDFDKLKDPEFNKDWIDEQTISRSIETNNKKSEILNNMKFYFSILAFVRLRIEKLSAEKLTKVIKEWK